MKQFTFGPSKKSRTFEVHPQASRQASVTDLLHRQFLQPAPCCALLPLQREGDGDEEEKKLRKTDMPDVFSLLPLEYKVHYRTQSFLPGRAEEDKTMQTIWRVLYEAVRRSLLRPGFRPTPEEINQHREAMDKRDAVVLLMQEADTLAGVAVGAGAEGGIRPFMPLGRLIDFEVPEIGKGKIEFFSKEKKNTLLFAAHGFQKGAGLSARLPEVKRAFAFMSGAGVSVTRNTVSPETYHALYSGMQRELDRFLLPNAPDLAVLPHRSGDALEREGGMLASVADEMDIAIFRDWEWSTGNRAKPFVISYVNTVPFDFLLENSLLKDYERFLMQVCRADWTKDAGIAGGGERSEPVLSTW